LLFRFRDSDPGVMDGKEKPTALVTSLPLLMIFTEADLDEHLASLGKLDSIAD
jgi:hypothetical protein